MLSCSSLKLKQIKEEKKKVIENYTSERTLRKKYYNMVEDMKGTRLDVNIKCLCMKLNTKSEAFLSEVVKVSRLIFSPLR